MSPRGRARRDGRPIVETMDLLRAITPVMAPKPVFPRPEWLTAIAQARTPQEAETNAAKVVLLRVLYREVEWLIRPNRQPTQYPTRYPLSTRFRWTPWYAKWRRGVAARTVAIVRDYLATATLPPDKRLVAHVALDAVRRADRRELTRMIRLIEPW